MSDKIIDRVILPGDEQVYFIKDGSSVEATSIANPYDATKSDYKTGDVVVYTDTSSAPITTKLYKAKSDSIPAGYKPAEHAAEWDEIKLYDELNNGAPVWPVTTFSRQVSPAGIYKNTDVVAYVNPADNTVGLYTPVQAGFSGINGQTLIDEVAAGSLVNWAQYHPVDDLNIKNGTGEGSIMTKSAEEAAGLNGVALGKAAKVRSDAENGTAVGYDSEAAGKQSVSIGQGRAEGDGSVAIKGMAYGDSSVTVGFGSTTKQNSQGAIAIGSANAGGDYSIAIGGTTAEGASNAISIGRMSQATAENAIAIGRSAFANAENAIAEGLGVTANQPGQHVTGVANDTTRTDLIDVIGNGDVNASGTVIGRSNAEATTNVGDKILMGDVYIHAKPNSTGGVKVVSPYDFAGDYLPPSTYNKGDIVISESNIYKAKVDGITGPWDGTKWEQIDIKDLFGGSVEYATKAEVEAMIEAIFG